MFKRLTKLLLATTILMGTGVFTQAHAYYWGYPPYGSGPFSSALWPLRAVLYPLRGAGYGPLGYNAAYFANSLLGTSMYRPYYYPRPYMNTYPYWDEEPYYSPRRRARPKRPDLYPTDQIAQAQWPPQPETTPAAAPIGMPTAGPGAAGAPVSAPQVAPAPGSAAPVGVAPGTPLLPQGGNSPIAQGFVDLVNSKFDGDISRALFDPEARSWAKSIGLVDNDKVFNADLSDERIELIGRVFKDRTLPAHAKIHSAKVLLSN